VSELPDELFDGHAVFCALTDGALTDGARKRTSAENVSDVLDALAKLIKARRSPTPAPVAAQANGGQLTDGQREALRAGANALEECRAIELPTGVEDQAHAYRLAQRLRAMANGGGK
jgi:hypothetical protein